MSWYWFLQFQSYTRSWFILDLSLSLSVTSFSNSKKLALDMCDLFANLFGPSIQVLVVKKSACSAGMQGTQVWSLGRAYPLEKETATHSSIVAWEIPWTKQWVTVVGGGLQSMGSYRVKHDWAYTYPTYTWRSFRIYNPHLYKKQV